MIRLRRFRQTVRALRIRATRRLRRAFGRGDSAERIARGVAAGVFAAALPLPGLQLPLSLLFAWAARGNKAVAILPQFLSNAGTMVPLVFLQFKIGSLVWPGKAAAVDNAMSSVRAVAAQWQWTTFVQSSRNMLSALGGLGADVLGPLAIGVAVTGTVLALASYPITVRGVNAWRARRERQREHKAARRHEAAAGGSGGNKAE